MTTVLIVAFVSASALAQVRQTRVSAPASAKSLPSSPVSYADVTRAAGIDFHLTCGGPEKRYIMESMCGGVAVFDYDNDGWMDIYLVNGSTLEDTRSGKCHPGKLYRNNHDGTFTDVSAKAGIAGCRWGFGVAVGDYDNDGWEDLYITYLDGAALYHNNHDGSFTDVTAKAGVGNAGRWGTSAAFGDYDNDGNLDLYVADYVDLDLNHLPEFGQGPFCTYRGIAVSCGPRGLKGARDRLYHNNGDGTFTDVTEKLNLDPDGYYGLGVLWLDYDLDGCLDLYVANDSSPSLLYHNDCKGGFTEVGAAAGVAYSGDGREQAGMGIDSADYDHDGWPDVFVADGHVNPQVDQHSFGVTYAERPLLFRNSGDGKLAEIALGAGPPLSRRYVARGTATADFLNNGSQDLLVTVLDSSPVLLRNQRPQKGHWLRIKAVGKKSNHDGFGARVEVVAGGVKQSAEIRANSSFESASDPRLHFGLGSATQVESVVVRWSSGRVDTIGKEDADQELIVEEGSGVVSRHGSVVPDKPPATPPSR